MRLSATEIDQLFKQARGGAQEALNELLRFCDKYVRGVVRRRLNRTVRSRLDGDDIVQNTWLIALVRWGENPFETVQQLLAFLRGTALNATRTIYHQHLDTLARDCRHERPLDEKSAESPPGDNPFSAVLDRDEWEWLLAGLPDAVRRIMVLRRAGHSTAAIARSEDVSQRTVQRLVQGGILTLHDRIRVLRTRDG